MKRAGPVFLFLLLVVSAAVAYPLTVRGSEWLAVRWDNKWALLLLLAVPVLFVRSLWGADDRVPRVRLGTLAPFADGPVGLRARIRDLPAVVRTVAFAMLVLALARPVSLLRPQESNDSGIDIVMVLDLSGSMRACMDGESGKTRSKTKRPTRLDVAKLQIREFVKRRKTDRIGAVVFGKSAYVLAPPTLDYTLLDTLVAGIEIEMIDSTGTAIGDALGTAVARLRRSEARSKAIVLLTDGDSNAGSVAPEYGAHLAKVVGAKVYTIQIGTGDDVDMQDGVDLFGNPHYVRAHFPVNPELLKKIAAETGGAAYVANDSEGLRKSMHEVLDHLEKTSFESQISSFEELFPLLLLPGTLLLGLDALLRAFVLRRFP